MHLALCYISVIDKQ